VVWRRVPCEACHLAVAQRSSLLAGSYQPRCDWQGQRYFRGDWIQLRRRCRSGDEVLSTVVEADAQLPLNLGRNYRRLRQRTPLLFRVARLIDYSRNISAARL
jgi:hypothetical protein